MTLITLIFGDLKARVANHAHAKESCTRHEEFDVSDTGRRMASCLVKNDRNSLQDSSVDARGTRGILNQ